MYDKDILKYPQYYKKIEVEKIGLDSIKVFIEDKSAISDYFQVKNLPDEITDGKYCFTIDPPADILKLNSDIKVELLDSAGNPIPVIFPKSQETIISHGSGNFEVIENVNSDGYSLNTLTGRNVQIIVYSDVAHGFATLTIVGEAKKDIYTNTLIPKDWNGVYNVKWSKKILVNKSFTSVNKSPILFYDTPTFDVYETTSSYIELKSSSSILITETSSGTYLSLETKKTSDKISAASTDAEGVVFYLKSSGFSFETKHIGANILVPSPSNINLRNDFGQPSFADVIKSIPQLASSTHIVSPPDTSDTGSNLFAYRTTIIDVINSSTAIVNPYVKTLSHGSGKSVDVYNLNYLSFDQSPYTMSYYTAESRSSHQKINSYINLKLKNLRTLSGEISKIKVLYKSSGEYGDYKPLVEKKIISQNFLIDKNGIDLGTFPVNIATASNIFDHNLYTVTSTVNLQPPGDLQFVFDSNHLLNSLKFVATGSDLSNSNNFYKIVHKKVVEFDKNEVYSISFDLIGQNYNNDDKAVIEFYFSGSSFSENNIDGYQAYLQNNNIQTSGIFGKYVCEKKLFGDDIPVADDKLPLLSLVKFNKVSYDFVPNFTGTGNLVIILRGRANWIINNINVSPKFQKGFSPTSYNIIVPNPSIKYNDNLDFKIEFYNPEEIRSYQSVETTQSVNFTGNNVVIEDNKNLIHGSVFVSNVIDSGIEISGQSSGFIRSVGYKGFTSASLGIGSPGFIIYSGSVLSASGDNYSGVGMDMILSSSKYFRFRTSPSELDIHTDSIFIGNPNTNYISASNGLLEISSSNFLLSSSGDVTMTGTIYAQSGVIAGLYIKSASIQNDPLRENSSILFGSSSYYWNSTNFTERDVIIFNFDDSGLNDLIHSIENYGNIGTPTNPATDYYFLNTDDLFNPVLDIDLSSATAAGDINVNSNGFLRLFYGTYNIGDNLDVYNNYAISSNIDRLLLQISLQRFFDEKSFSYTDAYATIKFKNSSDVVIDTQTFHLSPTSTSKLEFATSDYSLLIYPPVGAAYLNFYIDFYRFSDIVEDLTSRFKLNQILLTGVKTFLEISPSGLFYRADANKYIKLGKNIFEIKGNQIETDTIKIINTTLIGSASHRDGQLQISQYMPVATESGLYGNFGNYYYQQWISANGATNFKSFSSASGNSTTYYNFYNNDNTLIYKVYKNLSINTLDLSGSLRITGSAYINDKLGGVTNSGEILTFSKTVTSAVGVTSLPTVTLSVSGAISFSGGAVRLYDNPNYSYFMQRYEMGSSSLTLTNNSVNYIVISGSSGSLPAYIVTESVDSINESNIIPVYTAYRENNSIYYIDWDSLGRGLPNKLHQRLVKTNRFARESGLSIGLREESTTDKFLTLSEGRTWIGAVKHNPVALDSISDYFRVYYHSGSATTWTYESQNNLTNLWNYDSIVVPYGKTNLKNNEFSAMWVFRFIVDNESDLTEKWAIIPGTEAYSTETYVRASSTPAIPDFVAKMAIFVGRLIIEKTQDEVYVEVESAFTSTFSSGGGGPSAIPSHQDLTELMGGTAGEYFHLTSNEYVGTGTDVFVRKYNPTLSGSVSVLGDFTATSISETSDRTYKENIINLETQLDNINKLSPKRFNFIGDDRNQIGLIAQEVREIYPEFVKEDSNGKLSVEYSKLTGVLIKSLQEVNEKNIALEKRITELEDVVRNIVNLIK